MSNPFSAWVYNNDAHTRPSPTLGALPSSGSTSTDFMTFYFTSLNTTILNCTLTAPNGQPYLYVTTDPSVPGYSVFKTADGRSVALVEWNQRSAQVEIRGILHKQQASQYMRLSPDRRFRIMTLAGQEYAWVPRDNTICMYKVNSSNAACLAKLSREQGNFRLDVSPSVMQNGLLTPAVLGAVLLQSGRRIDSD
ncbi:hypothetical protein BDP27DRAFT_1254318 [Rhodocollybia butyracea]|uniref:DUF6593 domain-containing protein n=1 Tax=Rhodocollybia butyracea TaxID=206335 RepID=A0A9P5Q397_9AGAR|nr:hypothetical protein BDP27DRAFT_1254318 [Rhodocollybia butyracea]